MKTLFRLTASESNALSNLINKNKEKNKIEELSELMKQIEILRDKVELLENMIELQKEQIMFMKMAIDYKADKEISEARKQLFDYEEKGYFANKEIIITGYNGNESNLFIPSSINDKNVRAIASEAFRDNTIIYSVDIPKTVVDIGNHVFSGCSKLRNISVDYSSYHFASLDGVLYSKDGTKLFRCPPNRKHIVIPGRVRIIGTGAFDGCERLKDITLPDGLCEIEDEAFSGCTGMTEIVIPKSVEKIGSYVFDECKNLSSIIVDNDNKSFTSHNNVLYDKEMATLIKCPSQISKITIPDSVNIIANSAFDNCCLMNEIIIPEQVGYIGKDAFSGCKQLITIHVPARVSVLGEFAFDYCDNLSSITVDDNNEMFRSVDGVLYDKYCTRLIRCPETKETIIIPEQVTSIEKGAFAGCKKLEKIVVPKYVLSIGDYAFDKCENLKEINLPEYLTTIGECAFRGCRKLSVVYLSERISYIGEDAFENCNARLYCHKNTVAEKYAFDNHKMFFIC